MSIPARPPATTIDPRDPWFYTADPHAMCDVLFPVHGSGSTQVQPAALRHYLIALARRQWRHLSGPARTTVLLAECLADDELSFHRRTTEIFDLVRDRIQTFENTRDDVDEWVEELRSRGHVATSERGLTAGIDPDNQDWQHLTYLVSMPFHTYIPALRILPARFHHCELLRDVFFHWAYASPTVKKIWMTDQVVELARQIAKHNEFQLMSILGDALAEAGCENEFILSHCRNSPFHCRGCWVLKQCLALIEGELSTWAQERFIGTLRTAG